MRWGNYDKIKRIRKTDEEVQKILEGTKMFCSNKECKNTVVFKPDEMERKIMCGKCHSGIFVKTKPEENGKEKNEKEENKPKKNIKHTKKKDQ